jgi:cation diffusion facilitator family transporter
VVAHSESKTSIYAALAANLLIFASKLVAGLITGSTSMLSEAAHSFADTFNQVFLLIGLRAGTRPADRKHPFGHGKAPFFWSFITALMMWTVGGFFSVYEGIQKVLHAGGHEGSATVAYVTLLVALVFETVSLSVALRAALRAARSARTPLLRFLLTTPDSSLKTVVFEDLAAVMGLVLALAGVALTEATGSGIFDGAASITIGLVLFGVAFFIAREAYGYLMGQAASPEIESAISDALKSYAPVERVVSLRTMHISPTAVLAIAEVDFADRVSASELESLSAQLEQDIRSRIPEVAHLIIEPSNSAPQASSHEGS